MMVEQFVQKWKKKNANLKIQKYGAKIKKKNCLTNHIYLSEIDIQIHNPKLSGPMSKIQKNKAIFSSNNSKQEKKQNINFYLYI